MTKIRQLAASKPHIRMCIGMHLGMRIGIWACAQRCGVDMLIGKCTDGFRFVHRYVCRRGCRRVYKHVYRHMHRHTNRHVHRHVYRHASRHVYGHVYGHVCIYLHEDMCVETYMYIDMSLGMLWGRCKIRASKANVPICLDTCMCTCPCLISTYLSATRVSTNVFYQREP